jgi:Mce-associated membrane protein
MTPPSPPRQRLHPAVVVSIVLAVLLVGVAGAGIAAVAIVRSDANTQLKRADDLQRKLDAAGPDEQVRTAVLAAARAHVGVLFSYDYRKLDEYAAATQKVTTEKFGAEFAKTVAAIRPQQLSQQAVAKAEVTDAAVKDATATTAHVLLFVDTTTTTKGASTPSVQRTRVQLTLQSVSGQWLVDNVEAV